jgi:hypothetical protein
MVTKTGERKVALFKFKVEGSHASVSASKATAVGEGFTHGDVFEKKEQPNHPDAHGFGHGFVTYPSGYEGESFIVVQGSKPGSTPDEGKIEA